MRNRSRMNIYGILTLYNDIATYYSELPYQNITSKEHLWCSILII